MKNYFVTGIDTNIGKTIVSAILVEKLKADYWKPIQSGDLRNSDTIKVATLINNKKTILHPETYRLSQPLSPHAAAKSDKVTIDLKKLKLPKTKNTLVVEGAGGVMVPLNNKHLMVDLIKQLKTEAIVVIKNYLGSINHALLTIEALKGRKIAIAGIVFNGPTVKSSEEYILKYSGLKCLLRIGDEKSIDQATILKYSKKMKL